MFRNELQHNWVSASPDSENVLLHCDLLPSLGPLRRGLMDKVGRLTAEKIVDHH